MGRLYKSSQAKVRVSELKIPPALAVGSVDQITTRNNKMQTETALSTIRLCLERLSHNDCKGKTQYTYAAAEQAVK